MPFNYEFYIVVSVTDRKGLYNISTLAYWPSKDAYEAWAEQSGFWKWWQEVAKQRRPACLARGDGARARAAAL
jgi:hypothetical protein